MKDEDFSMFVSEDIADEVDIGSMTEGILKSNPSPGTTPKDNSGSGSLIGNVPLVIKIRFSLVKTGEPVLNEQPNELTVAGELQSFSCHGDTSFGPHPNFDAQTSISFDLEPSDFITLASAYQKHLRVLEALLLLPDGSERMLWAPDDGRPQRGQIIKMEFSGFNEYSCSCVLCFRD